MLKFFPAVLLALALAGCAHAGFRSTSPNMPPKNDYSATVRVYPPMDLRPKVIPVPRPVVPLARYRPSFPPPVIVSGAPAPLSEKHPHFSDKWSADTQVPGLKYVAPGAPGSLVQKPPAAAPKTAHRTNWFAAGVLAAIGLLIFGFWLKQRR